MAIGRTVEEALLKAVRSLEIGAAGLHCRLWHSLLTASLLLPWPALPTKDYLCWQKCSGGASAQLSWQHW